MITSMVVLSSYCAYYGWYIIKNIMASGMASGPQTKEAISILFCSVNKFNYQNQYNN